MKIVSVTLFLLLSGHAFAQFENVDHKFWDGTHKATFAISSAAKAGDIALSCRNSVREGFHEQYLPTQSCRGIALWLVGAQAGQLGLEYALHRAKLHRLEHITPFVFMSASGYGIGLNLRPFKKLPPN